MDVLELGTGMVFDTMDDCFRAIMHNMIIFGSMGLVLGVVLIVLGHRYQLFLRRNSILKKLVFLYYFYIPLLLSVTGLIAGGLIATENFTQEHLKDKILLVTKWTFHPYQNYIKENWNRFIDSKMTFEQTIDEYVSSLEYQPSSDSFWDEKQTYIANKVVPESVKLGIQTLVTTPKNFVLSESETDEEKSSAYKTLLAVKKMNIFEYDESFWGAMEKSMQEKNNKMFNGFYITLLISFILLIAVPAIETIIYKQTLTR